MRLQTSSTSGAFGCKGGFLNGYEAILIPGGVFRRKSWTGPASGDLRLDEGPSDRAYYVQVAAHRPESRRLPLFILGTMGTLPDTAPCEATSLSATSVPTR